MEKCSEGNCCNWAKSKKLECSQLLQRVQIVQGVQNVSCNYTKACLYLHNAQCKSARNTDFELSLHSIGISILIPNTFISYTLKSARRAKGGLQ